MSFNRFTLPFLLQLKLIILLEGFITISAEILVMRQLIPFVGNNVMITSLIIGIFLLFLAYGYRAGGAQAHALNKILARNFSLAAIFLGVGLSFSFISLFFLFFKHFLISNQTILIIYLLMVVAPLVFILGQTLPITMNLYQVEERAGIIGGKTLHLSTIGSFFGSLVTSLVLLNFAGVAWTVFLNFLLLCFLLAIVLEKPLSKIPTLVVMTGLGIVCFALNILHENQYFNLTTNYGSYRIIDNFNLSHAEKGRVLVINNSYSSFLFPDKKGAPYLELLKKILFEDLKLTHKEILVLGAGGFSLTAQGAHQNHFTYVDIDPKIKKIGERFLQAPLTDTFIASDARVYMGMTHQFDVVISDAYNSGISIPEYLLTYEHFVNIRRSIRENGYAIFNIIMKPTFIDKFSQRVDNTITRVFPKCMRIPITYTNEFSNVLYLCKKNQEDMDNVIYSDNKNQSTFDWKM